MTKNRFFHEKAVLLEALNNGKKPMANKYVLKLYIMGDTANSRRAIKNLNNILREGPKDLYTLDVIDVLKNPEAASEDKILATPMLMKVSPGPAKRIIGDLSDRGRVMSGLDLTDEPKQFVNNNENLGVML
jgi:circadian clock protein KaiB